MKIGVVRDDRFLAHKTGHTHPEKPARLMAVYRMLDREFARGLIDFHAEPATLEQLELVHTPMYIEKVLKTADHDFTSLALHTPVSARTYLAAWLAAGACLKGLEALMSGRCDACLCLVRPPGHHALPDRAAGFCVFNNLAITARHAIRRFGLERVLIIDWDVHHGNGIQEIFYSENSVLYLSTHDPLLFPYSGDWSEAGSGKGAGYTVNIPLPREVEDDDLLCVYRAVLEPILRSYRPELILVSAGFDAHRQDPVGRWNLSEAVYGHLVRLILELRISDPAPPLLFSLEGGYEPNALARCIREVIQALSTHPPGSFPPPVETTLGAELVERARQVHHQYKVWV